MLEKKNVAVEEPVAESSGLRFARHFTKEGVHPYDAVEWEVRDASITSGNGEIIFEQKNVEAPAFWSQRATNVVVNKYFRGELGTDERETSIRQLIDRVVDTTTAWGLQDGYFTSEEDAHIFQDELRHLLLHQMVCFNSPVWFNVGIDDKPQCSACFINSVEDTMPAILDLAKTEGMLFKFGSGTGTNLSTLRSAKEPLSGGGTASGPVSFMRGFDAFAGVIKSGGRTRRAAKMVILDIDHPDAVEFINCKADEERKAWTLIEAGYDAGFNVAGGAYDSVFFQNANHSIRVPDEFMEAVERDDEWTTHAVTDGRPMDSLKARELMKMTAEATWTCGDPGIQFETTINDWHTCSNSEPIYASNPCSEFMFLNDTACNLASLNLLRFYDASSEKFDTEGFTHACEVVITAQEIFVDNAGYPRREIEENSHTYRPLGLGFANLGALLMARGFPYDSEAGRDYAAAITALMSGAAYAQSAQIAAAKGPFAGFEKNRRPMLRVMRKHRDALRSIDAAHVPLELLQAAKTAWSNVLDKGKEYGLRNSQISVIAPTGTIAFMMDCDTTGIEPDIALVKFKRLVGGGMIRIVNRTVPVALRRLGYDQESIDAIVEYIDEHGTIEGAPGLADENLPVFDCAFAPATGDRSISYLGHLKMVAAVQPFISGAISKTINMPEDTTAQEIEEAYMQGWRMGLKAIAIYRDGCKRSQPLTTSKEKGEKEPLEAGKPMRKKLPDERQAITHKFSVSGHEGYLTVGLYEDGKPGEIFVVMAKEGSTISGLMDGLATSISIALQYGVPLKTLVTKFSHTRFEPSGFTNNPQIPIAKSVMDYIFRWLASKFLSTEEQRAVGIVLREGESEVLPSDGLSIFPADTVAPGLQAFRFQQDAPSCQECGSIMVRAATCYQCLNCGSTSGCG
jgi:ribonucleoside-diphosphate reductase alpha chain